MQEITATWGWIGVASAVLFFGIMNVPIKIQVVQRTKVDPMVLQLYYAITIFASSWLLLLFNDGKPFHFSYWGVIGAALWVPASIFSIFALRFLGLSIAQGLWSGATILVSFLWGSIVFRDPIKNGWLTALGMILLLLGILGVALCKSDDDDSSGGGDVSGSGDSTGGEAVTGHSIINGGGAVSAATAYDRIHDEHEPNLHIDESDNHVVVGGTDMPPKDSGEHLEHHTTDDHHHHVAIDDTASLDTPPLLASNRRQKVVSMLKKSRNFILGLLCCAALGLFNGSMMVPARYNPEKSIIYCLSFGIGVMIVTPVLFVLYFLVKREIPKFHVKDTLFPGLLVGFIWNLGNVGSTIAALSPLGLTVGFPLTQCALVVGGIVGIVFFRELRGWKAILQFTVFTLLFLLPGCMLLAIFGKK